MGSASEDSRLTGPDCVSVLANCQGQGSFFFFFNPLLVPIPGPLASLSSSAVLANGRIAESG